MPLNGDTAGLCAYIDGAENPWMSIGGRQIRNCIKLAFYPSKADRDILFEHNVNSVTNFSNEGNVIWGDWTRVDNTAFNFLGVRRMFLYVEKNIKQYARTIMFKQNDQITRDEFILAVTPFLDAIVGGRGIQEYGVFAGEDVTSPEEMDRGIFRAKFAIKPVRSIRYVDLVFVAIRSDMSVSEVME
jgi:phage tail sheath protein FI